MAAKKKLIAGAHYYLACGSGNHVVDLGAPHGHPVKLFHDPRKKTTMLRAGCHAFHSAAEAKKHYSPNYKSGEDGLPRPHGQAVVAYAQAICKTNGWKW